MEIHAKDLYFLQQALKEPTPPFDEGGAVRKKSDIAEVGLSKRAGKSAQGKPPRPTRISP
jgi:hypothetical protein